MTNLELIVAGSPKSEGKDFPTLKEIKRLKAVTKRRKNYTSIKEWFIIDLAISTGLSLQEIVNLDYGDLIIDQYRLKIKKGRNQRTVIFGENFKEHAGKYLKLGTRKSNDPLIQNYFGKRMLNRAVQKVFKRCAARAGINPSYSIKSLRYAYAYHLYKASKFDPDVVHSQLGVKDIHFRKKCPESIGTRTRIAVERMYKQ